MKELRMMEIRLVASVLALVTAFRPVALASTTKVEETLVHIDEMKRGGYGCTARQ